MRSMRIDREFTEEEIIKELSRRFKQYRIAHPMTQAELEEVSMVSLSTIKRFESGKDISLSKFIQLLKPLGIQEHLEVLIPDQSNRPSFYVNEYRPKLRARKKKKEREWK